MSSGLVLLEPEGLALALVVVSITFAILTTITVGLRVYIRNRTRSYGADDWVMLAGYVVNMGTNVAAIRGGYVGIGTVDDKLGKANIIEGLKTLLVWQALYASSRAMIKSSICITIMRVAPDQRVYITILRLLIVLSGLLSVVGVIIILNLCHPLPRYWDKEVPGTCLPEVIVIIMSYAASVVNVVTDACIAIIPVFLLRGLNIRPKYKRYVHVILGLGLTAGIASIIRLPYSNAYGKDHDVLYHSGNIVLWTAVECGLGIIAGSLPALRSFFKNVIGDPGVWAAAEARQPRTGDGGSGLVTIGRLKDRHASLFEPEVHVTSVGGAESDDESRSPAHAHMGRKSGRVSGESVSESSTSCRSRGEGVFG